MRACGERVRDLDRALAAHLCRCTGWRTVYDAIRGDSAASVPRDLVEPRRCGAELEGGVPQVVRADVPLGGAPFADDTAPRDALVAVPLPPGSAADAVEAAGMQWVVGPSLLEARAAAGKVQGRRTTAEERPPLFDRLPACPPGGVRLATSWVEPAYLEPDASWCEPGGVAGVAARQRRRVRRQVELTRARCRARARGSAGPSGAGRLLARGRRSPGSEATADRRERGVARRRHSPERAWSRWAGWRRSREWPTPYTSEVVADWREVEVAGPPVGTGVATGLAELAVLVEGAIDAAGVDRASLTDDPALLDVCVRRRRARARVRACTSTPRPVRSIASKCASRPAIRSTRSCCVPTRSARRTWRWDGCAPSR